MTPSTETLYGHLLHTQHRLSAMMRWLQNHDVPHSYFRVVSFYDRVDIELNCAFPSFSEAYGWVDLNIPASTGEWSGGDGYMQKQLFDFTLRIMWPEAKSEEPWALASLPLSIE